MEPSWLQLHSEGRDTKSEKFNNINLNCAQWIHMVLIAAGFFVCFFSCMGLPVLHVLAVCTVNVFLFFNIRT